LGGDYDFFLLRLNTPAVNKDLACIWDSFNFNRKMTIEIDYEVQIKSGQEKKVIESLIENNGDSLGDTLDNLVKKASNNFFQKKDTEKINVFDNYNQAIENNETIQVQHEAYIEESIEKNNGFKIKVRTKVSGSQSIRPREDISSLDALYVNLLDSKEKISIRYLIMKLMSIFLKLSLFMKHSMNLMIK